VPQVHGIVHDTLAFVRQIIATELNSATDNPLVFSDRGEIISGGNFHGEYPAKALDYLAIGVSELAQMSERRLERLMNPTLRCACKHSPPHTMPFSGLPAFLAKDGGLNSGFMMVQVTAASLGMHSLHQPLTKSFSVREQSSVPSEQRRQHSDKLQPGRPRQYGWLFGSQSIARH
jgi:histidine ammonia-lyase